MTAEKVINVIMLVSVVGEGGQHTWANSFQSLNYKFSLIHFHCLKTVFKDITLYLFLSNFVTTVFSLTVLNISFYVFNLIILLFKNFSLYSLIKPFWLITVNLHKTISQFSGCTWTSSSRIVMTRWRKLAHPITFWSPFRLCILIFF